MCLRFVSLLSTVCLLVSPQAFAAYHLTFDDEFNSFDNSRWQTCDFWGMRNNPGDFQGQWFADPKLVPAGSDLKPYVPFVCSDGILAIRAQPTPKDTYSGADGKGHGQPFVSGQLTSAHRFTQCYGYYELRAKLPAGKGLWSRFWLLTDDGNWPGEYDIFEVLGKENPAPVRQATHYRDATTKHGTDAFAFQGAVPTDGKFHVYGFLWEPATVTWYVDGVETLKQVNRINIPMYVLIDLAIGHDPANLWPGDPDGAIRWPVNMELDYYRVYSDDPSIPSVAPDPGYAPSVLPGGLQVETMPTTTQLPPGWAAIDIGSPEVKGSSAWNVKTGRWMLKGAGFGIGGYGDQCQFAGTPLEGDGGIIATVRDATAMNLNSVKAGVMIREGTDRAARNLFLYYNVFLDHADPHTTNVVLQSRDETRGTTTTLATVPVKAPVSLRLMRSGKTFTAAYSSDGGAIWSAIGAPQTLAMGRSVQAGLAVGGSQDNYLRLSRANFSDVAVGQLPPALSAAPTTAASATQPVARP